MNKIYVIGAGQIGSRHLQALAAVKSPLEITVIDPHEQSLALAKERYEQARNQAPHKLSYKPTLPRSPQEIDLAIVATTSEVRAEAIRALLRHAKVRYLILEKLLFQKKTDYEEIGRLLLQTKTQTWVNCTMRTMPFYYQLKTKLAPGPIRFQSRFSNYGLISNTIHYLDYLVFLTGLTKFSLDLSHLDPQPVESKRKGFLEFLGTLRANFPDDSQMSVTCFTSPQPKIEISIEGRGIRCQVFDLEEKAVIQGKTQKARVPYISEMTTQVVNRLWEDGTCVLTTYKESAVVHLGLLEPVLEFLNKRSAKKYNYYPFT